MNNFKAIILGCMIVFLFASCASMRINELSTIPPTVPMATREQGASAKKFQVPTNKTILYLIRPSQFNAR